MMTERNTHTRATLVAIVAAALALLAMANLSSAPQPGGAPTVMASSDVSQR